MPGMLSARSHLQGAATALEKRLDVVRRQAAFAVDVQKLWGVVDANPDDPHLVDEMVLRSVVHVLPCVPLGSSVDEVQRLVLRIERDFPLDMLSKSF